MVDPRIEQYQERIETAFVAAGVIRRLAWVVLAVGVAALLGEVFGAVTGRITIQSALMTIAGTILAGILAGVTAYAAGVNLGLAASRLEHAIRDEATTTRDEHPIDLDS